MLKKISYQGKGELAFAGSLVLLGLLVLWDTTRIELPQGNNIVNPRTFPYIIGALVLVIGIALIVEVLRGKLGTPEGDEPGASFIKADRKTMLMMAAAVAVHVALLEKAGYIIAATFGFWGLATTFGSRKPIKDFAISLIFALVVYFAFSWGLNIQLPQGILSNILPD